MHGLLIVNKPEGPTSFDVVRQVRRICGTRKVGHGGTLDPMATGVLPVAVGQATRLLELLLEGEKVYRARLRLGITTDTQDREGAILQERPWTGICVERVREALQGFLGEQDQLPPMYSALKHRGQPLYKLARQGVAVERRSRRVTIKEVALLGAALPEVDIEVHCSKGTYIRTLIHDLGERLGCGAHMIALQRTAALPFRLEQAVDLASLAPGTPITRGWFTPLQAVAHLPRVRAGNEALGLVRDGVPPRLEQVSFEGRLQENELVAIAAGDALLALARFGPDGRLDSRGDFGLLKVFHGG